MKKETFDTLVQNAESDFAAVHKAVAIKPPKVDTKYGSIPANQLSPMDEYNVENHPVFDPAKRFDKKVEKKNKEGQVTSTETKAVNRIGLAFEPMIAGTAAAMLCANPIIYGAAPEGPAQEKFWAAFKKVNENAKLDFKNLSILETRMAETKVAEIWFLDGLDEEDDYWEGTEVNAQNKLIGKPRLFLAQPSLGDELYPVWSGQDNLLAIGREYKEREGEKEIEHFDLYTADFIYEATKTSGGWEVNKVPNDLKKIPVVYHAQPDVEWAKVRAIIRRLEDIHSNFADSNDRTAFPILGLFGDVVDLPQGVADKAMKFKEGAKAEYIAPPNAPDAIKLEVDNLLRQLYSLTDTPDISFDNLKGLGTTSGFALQMMFMGAHLKAARHAGTFGECVQRRVNMIKRMLITIDPSLKEGASLVIKPTFDFFMPKDVAGTIDMLVTAVTGKIISQETAVAMLQATMGGDGVAEFQKVLKEAESKQSLDSQFS